MQQLLQTRRNEYLALPPAVTLTTDPQAALSHSQTVVISVSTQSLRGLLTELPGLQEKELVFCMKGIEEGTGLRLTQIAAQCGCHHTAVWVGPGHVQDFLRGCPNCMVIDSLDSQRTRRLAGLFSSDLIRFYYGRDLIGNEIGAAAKNVIGIAAGLLDGLDRSSLKGALMARGAREIARLIGALGGEEMTAYGLSHLGDYEATVFSPHSHNRQFGEAFAKNIPFAGGLAEGAYTVKALMLLSQRTGMELPICQTVEQVIHHGQPPKEALSSLFLRSLKEEF